MTIPIKVTRVPLPADDTNCLGRPQQSRYRRPTPGLTWPEASRVAGAR
jgi:hypothetical protein